MKNYSFKTFILVAIMAVIPMAASAQTSNSLLGPNGIGWNPGPMIHQNQNQIPVNTPMPAPGFVNPPLPNTTIVYAPQLETGIANQGITKVVACGYDFEGIWRVIPLTVSYQYNGAQYDVNVLNAWNPWTDTWDRGVDQPAFNTYIFQRGIPYSFYTVLSTGTYYFNL